MRFFNSFIDFSSSSGNDDAFPKFFSFEKVKNASGVPRISLSGFALLNALILLYAILDTISFIPSVFICNNPFEGQENPSMNPQLIFVFSINSRIAKRVGPRSNSLCALPIACSIGKHPSKNA